MHLEQVRVTVFVKRIELNPTCSIGYILPVAIAVVLFHSISSSCGGLALERHESITSCQWEEKRILLNLFWIAEV